MRNPIQLLVFLISLFSVNLILAQSLHSYIKTANKAYTNGEYGKARHYYKIAIDADSKKSNILWQYADCSRRIYDYTEAELFYSKLLQKTKSTQKFPLLKFYYATVLKYNQKYELSGQYFQAFIDDNKANPGDFFIKKARQECLAISNIQNLVKTNPNYTVKLSTKPGLNTDYSDFAAHWVGDKIYYSSLRYQLVSADFKDSSTLCQIAADEKLIRNINSPKIHTANSSTDTNLTRLVFTRCEGTGENIRCDLWTADGDGKGNWTNSRKLPAPLNQKSCTSTMPCLSTSSEPKWLKLYFVSNRSGGQGGLDIWSCDLSSDGDEFKNLQNLGAPINTPGDEVTPFFSNKLYFSSDWHEGLGGYDIFCYDSSQITNLKPPINSSANDIYFSLKSDLSQGFISSNRKNVSPLQNTNMHACCYDIYEWGLTNTYPLYPPEERDSTPYIASTLIPHSIPPLIDTNTIEIPKPNPLPDPSELLPITLYFHNDEPDSNSLSLSTTTIYEDTYEKYFALKETYKVAYGANLPAAELYGARQSVEHFFQDEVKQGYDDLEEFTQRLLAHLEAGEQIEVGIEGYTSPRAAANYNDALSSRRIASVENHFEAFQSGVLKPFLASKQLVIKRVPYGESRVPKGVNADYKNTRLSIYSPAAAAERRVQIISVKLK